VLHLRNAGEIGLKNGSQTRWGIFHTAHDLGDHHQSVQLCKNGIFCYVRIWLKNYLTFNERIISFLQLTK